MEKLKKHISKEYLPVKIYIDDLEKIVAVLDDNSIKYSIETDFYKYDNLTELIKYSTDKAHKNLKIQTSNPYMTIEFHKMWAKIYVSVDDMLTTGLFHKIDEIINQSRRLIPFFYSYYFVWIVNILLPIENALINRDGKLFHEYIDTTLYILWILWLARTTYIRLVKHSSIQLIKKEHVSSFFQRKRDDLILALLSALVGAILGVIGTILTTKFLN